MPSKYLDKAEQLLYQGPVTVETHKKEAAAITEAVLHDRCIEGVRKSGRLSNAAAAAVVEGVELSQSVGQAAQLTWLQSRRWSGLCLDTGA